MTINKTFIHQVALRRGLNVPDALLDWLTEEYAIEPYEGFWEACVLEELIVSHHDAYWSGQLVPEIPDPVTLWKKRCEFLKGFIEDMIAEHEELCDEYNSLKEQLKQLGITVDGFGNIEQ